MLTLTVCPTAAGSRFRVAERDPRTGAPTWKYDVPKASSAWLVSRDPLVVALIQSDDGLDSEQLVTATSQGTTQSTITLGKDYIAGCTDPLPTCNAITVVGNTAFLPTDPYSLTDPSDIAAFDLRTGQKTHTFKSPDESTWGLYEAMAKPSSHSSELTRPCTPPPGSCA
ncbi:hypothetical protein ACFV98_35225 [Streptomyces violascens]|uniref:hypothetical protein n=1 Tax=Streptomyces violascens TaxID=67381 RepID=UPI00365C4460